MPQIKEYASRVQTAGPMQVRKVSGEDLGYGRALQQAGAALQNTGDIIYKRVEQDEISTASVAMSQAHSEFTNKLNTDLQQGTINSEEFTKQYDDYMGKVSEQFSTRGGKEYFTKASASMRAHFVESSFAGQSELAGIKSRQDYEKTLNNFSSGLMGDPSSYGVVKQVHDDYVDNLVKNGSLPYAQGEKLKTQGNTELAKASVRGWIDLNPEDARDQLKRGTWDANFDGDVKKQLIGEAEMGVRAKEVEAERRRQEAERAKVERQKQTQNAFLEKMVSGSLSSKEILKSNLEAFGSGSKEQFIQLMKTAQKDRNTIKTDSGTFTTLFNRIHADDTDPNKITDENELNKFLGKGLTLEDIKNLRGEMQGRGTMAGKEESILKQRLMDTAKNRLTRSNPMLGIKDPQGDEQLQRYTNFFMTQYAEGRKKGKTTQDLLDPDSPDYLGKYIGNYSKTPQQIMQDLVKMNRPQAPIPLPDGSIPAPGAPAAPMGEKARKPGESIQQWRERTKGNQQ